MGAISHGTGALRASIGCVAVLFRIAPEDVETAGWPFWSGLCGCLRRHILEDRRCFLSNMPVMRSLRNLHQSFAIEPGTSDQTVHCARCDDGVRNLVPEDVLICLFAESQEDASFPSWLQFAQRISDWTL